MDLRRIVAPINRFIYVANNETLEVFVIGSQLSELVERVPVIRE